MGITYHLDKQRRTTFVRWEGVVAADEFLTHVRRLIADSAWPTGRRHLTDLRSASSDPSIDEATLEAAANLFGEHRDKIANMQIAIVAEKEFPKSRIFERYFSKYGANVIVFAQIATACVWLGIDAYEAERILQELRGSLCRNNPSAGGP